MKKKNITINNTSLNELCKDIHCWAQEKGFWDYNINTDEHLIFAQKNALIHSEISESLEADRKNRHADLEKFDSNALTDVTFNDNFKMYIKDTVEDELADAIIRILDWCGYMNIDIERHIKEKMKFNNIRERRHGKEY